MSLGSIREVVAELSYDVDSSQLEKGEQRFQSFSKKIVSVTKAIVGAAVLGKLVSTLDQTTTEIINLNNEANKLNMPLEELRSWSFVVDRAGLDTGFLSDALTDLGEKFGEAVSDVESGPAKIFKNLGVTLKDAEGNARNLGDVFKDTALAISEQESAAEKLFFANQLMADSGRRLIPVFNQGAAALENQLDKFKQLGGQIGEGAIKQAQEYKEAKVDLKVATEALVLELGTGFIPALTKLIKTVTPFIKVLGDFISGLDDTELTMLGVTAATTGLGLAIWGLTGPIGWIIGAVTLLGTLIGSELKAAYEGNESALVSWVEANIGSIDPVLKGWIHFQTMLEVVFSNVEKGFKQMYQFVLAGIEALGASIQKLFSFLGKIPGISGTSFGNFFDSIGASADEGFSNVGKRLKEINRLSKESEQFETAAELAGEQRIINLQRRRGLRQEINRAREQENEQLVKNLQLELAATKGSNIKVEGLDIQQRDFRPSSVSNTTSTSTTNQNQTNNITVNVNNPQGGETNLQSNAEQAFRKASQALNFTPGY